MQVYVLRLGHRPERDKRISTHVALTARAFGADGIYFSVKDGKLFRKIEEVKVRWGGNFFVEYRNWKELLKNFEGLKVHLTMYGVPLPDRIDEIKRAEKVIVVVGAEKVPPEVYDLCDMNVSIGNQPHSEVAALAIFLDRVLDRKVFRIEFPDARIKVIPSERGKKIEEIK
ncbi:MAG TPA: tRNA (cytidine(56)-2'-O)-methyltransferase [Archaeoglobaceae archaeon]|nr:tRNA (cytidine(56)-2'-O)-methyltransferase [Archaeoglobaceae archaeon]